MEYFEIINAIDEKDLIIPVAKIYATDTTEVFRVDLPEKLIVKYSIYDEDAIQFQSQLLDKIDRGDHLTAKILYWETRKIDGIKRIIQILPYLDGNPIKTFPDLIESKAINQAVFKLHRRLKETTVSFNSEELISINTIFPRLVAMSKDSFMKDAGKRLLEQERYREICNFQPFCLIDGDLWPENLLVDKRNEKIEVRILDLDPVLLGPPILQPAILFSSCFLISYLMDSRGEKPSFNFDRLLSHWPEPLDKQDVLIMMQVFPIALSLQKEMNGSQDFETYNKSLNLYSKCLTYIQSLMN